MTELLGLNVSALIWAAFIFNLFGFLARDELLLRVFMFVGSILSIGYYSLIVVDQPLWDAILTRGTLMLANGLMICIVVSERTTWFMSLSALDLYRSFSLLTPGQFRRIRKKAVEAVASEETVVLREGETADRLFFVISGNARVDKAGTTANIGDRVFLGEIVFMRGGDASATVTLEKGTQYLAWDHSTLKRMQRRDRELAVAMIAQFNDDLMSKVAGSPPADMRMSQLVSRTV